MRNYQQFIDALTDKHNISKRTLAFFLGTSYQMLLLRYKDDEYNPNKMTIKRFSRQLQISEDELENFFNNGGQEKLNQILEKTNNIDFSDKHSRQLMGNHKIIRINNKNYKKNELENIQKFINEKSEIMHDIINAYDYLTNFKEPSDDEKTITYKYMILLLNLKYSENDKDVKSFFNNLIIDDEIVSNKFKKIIKQVENDRKLKVFKEKIDSLDHIPSEDEINKIIKPLK